MVKNVEESLQIEIGALQKILLEHRPLVIHEFMKCGKERIFDRLKRIGEKLCRNKRINEEEEGYRMVWLTGVYLMKDTLHSCPCMIRSTEMVRRHYFEPRAKSVEQGIRSVGEAYVGKQSTIESPLVTRIIKCSPLDYEAHSSKEMGSQWVMEIKKDGEKMTAITKDFSSVTNVLAALCTQQCLIKEPLLAIALSTQHRLSIEEFHHGIYKCFVESHSERCHDALCGEQVELIVFAALQMANGNEIEKPNSLKDFIDKLIEYLHPKIEFKVKALNQSFIEEFGLENVIYLEPTPKVTFDINKLGTRLSIIERIMEENVKEKEALPTVCLVNEEDCERHKVPWLVPGYTEPELQTHSSYQDLFGETYVGALIPKGIQSDHFDMSAVKWPPKDNIETLWKFEVKARSNGYTMNEAITDLIKKCGDRKNDSGLHDAMLIAIRRKRRTEYTAWTVEKNGKKYIRVILLIAGIPNQKNLENASHESAKRGFPPGDSHNNDQKKERGWKRKCIQLINCITQKINHDALH